MDAVTAGSREFWAEAEAMLRLQGLPGVGDARLGALLERFGGASAALGAPRSAFAAVVGRRAASARAGDDEERVRSGLAWCRSNGVAVRVRGLYGYPEPLTRLADPPAVVFLRGDASLLERPTVAVVGSRRSTEYGRRVARQTAQALARAGVVVASGLALGIDGAAHEGALEAGGTTLAVLGTGPDRAYPARHRPLFRRIAREGLLVSEFLPGEPALPHHFPRRNRILAALSRAVVVVEAAARSGALITADHALDLGSDVIAVPGPIDRATSRGTNDLIRLGAHPLIEPSDVVELAFGPGVVPSAGAVAPGDAPTGGEDARVVLAALDAIPRHVDEIAARSGLGPGRALAALALLELTGHVRQEPGQRWSAAA